jgi:methionyl-tRNA synthetase
MGKFYITTPIYYVNDEPHLGHAYTTIIADVLARYHRSMGDSVLFLTGTDEHGQKVEQAAKARRLSPLAHCNEMVLRYESLWKKLNISHDDFIRTTEPRHTKVVQQILQNIFDAGEIYADDYEGWYSVHDERFWTEKDLVDGKDPVSGREVIQISERNYFFRMSEYQEWLVDHIETHPEFIRPNSRRNEILGFLKNPLNDLCISRPKSRLKWGIELPFDAEYVCYVWFDALINYITAPGYLEDDQRFEKWWPASCHLIGKDILTTHCVYWPTMLKAMGLPLPETILGHGWWMVEEQKMSKSLGNVIRPLELAEKYGVDGFRYFLAREMGLGLDGSFSEKGFVQRYNSELANDLGNLLNRTVVMTQRYLGGITPQVDPSHPALAGPREHGERTVQNVRRCLAELNPNGILDTIWELVRAANKYAEVQGPWNLAKDPSRSGDLEATLYGLLETMRYLAVLTFPVMPGKASEMWRQLGLGGEISEQKIDGLTPWGGLEAGTKVAPGEPVFPRIEIQDLGDSSPEPRQKKEIEMPDEQDELISFKDFQKLKLRVATITEAERVEGADRLLKLQVSLGTEKRQLVAGVAEHYDPDALIGRKIIVLTNLEPATIRGVESQGMLLAASSSEGLALLQPDSELADGSEVR